MEGKEGRSFRCFEKEQPAFLNQGILIMTDSTAIYLDQADLFPHVLA